MGNIIALGLFAWVCFTLIQTVFGIFIPNSSQRSFFDFFKWSKCIAQGIANIVKAILNGLNFFFKCSLKILKFCATTIGFLWNVITYNRK